MKLLVEKVNEVEYLTEDVAGKKSLYIRGPFLQAECVNRNNRRYPADIMEKAASKYIKDKVNESCAWMELGHPADPTINLERACGRIVELMREGNNWIGKARILTSTPFGKIVEALINDGGKLGVSSRGVGSLKQMSEGVNVVQDDYHIATAADIVADPSAPDAYVSGIMEQKEWVWNNGIIVESEIAKQHKTIKEASKFELEAVTLAQFATFFAMLSK